MTQKIIVAAAVLHNIAVINRENFEDIDVPQENDGDIVFPDNNHDYNVRHNNIQQTYIDYFESLIGRHEELI